MAYNVQSSLKPGFPLIGVLLATIGLYLPWVKVSPAHEGRTIDIFLPGMEAGFTAMEAGLLLPGLLALLLTVRGRQSQFDTVILFCVGLLYIVLPFYHAETVLIAPFTSAVGAYVTGLGGLFLVTGSAVYRLTPSDDGLRGGVAE